ncbi:VOC family protein [Desertihabitans aurantiacus]|uniref:VOC family protein n=1 Tax=Desertihabitans aurantiacus TaxID=2282477 RepID=UPI000DF7A699|nr:VOC family protein [Desertihabitans aurantiacus]
MTGPRIELTSVTITSPAPRRLARFWAELLGWPVTADEPPGPGEPPEAGWAQVRPPEGVHGFTLNLEWERHYRRPVWPAEPDAQVATQHLDLHTDDVAAAVARAVGLGAVLAEHQPQEHVRVLLDPDGHPFCFF